MQPDILSIIHRSFFGHLKSCLTHFLIVIYQFMLYFCGGEEGTNCTIIIENKTFYLWGCSYLIVWKKKKRKKDTFCEIQRTWPILSVSKDTSYLQAGMITSALMILSGSFKLETWRKVNENELRYNPLTLQTSSACGQRYISFRGSLCEKEEALQWQPYYLFLFKVKARRSIELRIEK